MGLQAARKIGKPGITKPKFKNPNYLRQSAQDINPPDVGSSFHTALPFFINDFGFGSNVVKLNGDPLGLNSLETADIDYIEYTINANVTNTSPVTGQNALLALRSLTANAVDGPTQSNTNYGDTYLITQGETKNISRTQRIDGATFSNNVFKDLFATVEFSGTVNEISFSITVKLL